MVRQLCEWCSYSNEFNVLRTKLIPTQSHSVGCGVPLISFSDAIRSRAINKAITPFSCCVEFIIHGEPLAIGNNASSNQSSFQLNMYYALSLSLSLASVMYAHTEYVRSNRHLMCMHMSIIIQTVSIHWLHFGVTKRVQCFECDVQTERWEVDANN